jgi:iron complex transport system substrate-binding protein
MRIASLVPSSTEMLFALGLGESVVAVTHECDYPPGVSDLEHLTRSVIEDGLTAGEIDAAVRARTSRGLPLYELDEALLAELEPDLIVTQAVCEVCAVSYDDVVAAAGRLPSRPKVLSLDPSTLGEVLADVPRLAGAAGAVEAGEDLIEQIGRRIDVVVDAVAGAERPSVAALEWLDPVFVAGHWVPQMIELAGGEDVLGLPGERSRTVKRAEVGAARPEVVVAMPCGYDTGRSAQEAADNGGWLSVLDARVAAVNASAYFSRPGPRLVDGVELLGHLLHPDRIDRPPAGRFTWLDLRRSATVS